MKRKKKGNIKSEGEYMIEIHEARVRLAEARIELACRRYELMSWKLGLKGD